MLKFLSGKLHKCGIRIGISPGIDSCKTPLIGDCCDAWKISISQTFLNLFQSLCTVIGKSVIANPAFFFQFFQNIHDLFHRFFRIISVKPIKINLIFSQCTAAFIQICPDILPVHSATARIFKRIMCALGSYDHFPPGSPRFQPSAYDLLTAVPMSFQPFAVHIGCINKISTCPYKGIQNLKTFFLIQFIPESCCPKANTTDVQICVVQLYIFHFSNLPYS